MVLLLAALVGPLACGKEAAPQPPVIRVAERTSDLVAVQEGQETVLRWSYPAMTTAGQSLSEVEAVEVWRATLPRAQEPPPAVTPRDRELQRQLLEAEGEVVATLDPQALHDATRGAGLVWRDDLSRWSAAAELAAADAVIWYGVRTVCCGGRQSELSNVARVLPAEPPPPPESLRATASADGIELEWQQPSELLALVERSPDGATWSPLTEEPIREDDFRDTTAEQGRSWSYRVRSVARPEGGGRVVGQPSEPVRVDHPDTYPPPPPTDVVCLPEGAQVRVRWGPVPGAAGYRVSRQLADGTGEVLAEDLGGAELLDGQPPLGELLYLVAARDAAGNLSPPVTCSVVMGAVP